MSEVRNIYWVNALPPRARKALLGLRPFRRWGGLSSGGVVWVPPSLPLEGSTLGSSPVPLLCFGLASLYIKAWASAALPALSHAAVCYGLQVCCDLGSLFVSGPPRTVLPVQFRVPSSDRWSWGVAEA